MEPEEATVGGNNGRDSEFFIQAPHHTDAPNSWQHCCSCTRHLRRRIYMFPCIRGGHYYHSETSTTIDTVANATFQQMLHRESVSAHITRACNLSTFRLWLPLFTQHHCYISSQVRRILFPCCTRPFSVQSALSSSLCRGRVARKRID